MNEKRLEWSVGREIRGLELVLGVWLFLSAFVWPHTPERTMNCFVVGSAVVAASIFAGVFGSKARYVTLALGGWLLISLAVFSPQNVLTTINELFVALALIASAFAPSKPAEGFDVDAHPPVSGLR